MTAVEIQRKKELVWDFWEALERATGATVGDVVTRFVAPQVDWKVCQPINRIDRRADLITRYWQPLMEAFPDLRRDPYIFFGGSFRSQRAADNQASFGDWVCATGDFVGTFARDFLGIPATASPVRLRFGEFCRVENDRIVGGRVILDLVDFLRLAGVEVLPPQLGDVRAIPGPATGDGVLRLPQDEQAGMQSLVAVETMLFEGLATYDQQSLASMGNQRYWREDMHWYGPGGIGTTYGISGFEALHQAPFLHAFPDRKGGHHDVRIAEGMYVASTGWPSLLATHAGDYLGAPATHKRISMRVMDWWRRDGELLAENWIFIDMLDLFLQFGIDLLAAARTSRAG